MLYVWQLERGKAEFRFQTDNKGIAAKMKRRNNFKLVGWGVNCDLWIFQTVFGKPETARKALKALARNAVKFDKKDDVFYAPIDMTKNENRAA